MLTKFNNFKAKKHTRLAYHHRGVGIRGLPLSACTGPWCSASAGVEAPAYDTDSKHDPDPNS